MKTASLFKKNENVQLTLFLLILMTAYLLCDQAAHPSYLNKLENFKIRFDSFQSLDFRMYRMLNIESAKQFYELMFVCVICFKLTSLNPFARSSS